MFKVIFMLTISQADNYVSEGKNLTKMEAVKLLLELPNQVINRCYQVKLNDKLNLVKKK